MSLLAKIWYLTQSLPPTTNNVKQLTAIASRFIWHGAMFRVPMSTLQRGKDQGGWGMENIAVKCKMLLYNRMSRAKEGNGTFTALLMKRWKIDSNIKNPPRATIIPRILPHLYQYAIDMAYIPPMEATETMEALKRRITKVLTLMENNACNSPTLWIIRKNPDISWMRVWRNLQTPGLSDSINSAWYEAIHDILPTHHR
jgi:hypothetical protein